MLFNKKKILYAWGQRFRIANREQSYANQCY